MNKQGEILFTHISGLKLEEGMVMRSNNFISRISTSRLVNVASSGPEVLDMPELVGKRVQRACCRHLVNSRPLFLQERLRISLHEKTPVKN